MKNTNTYMVYIDESNISSSVGHSTYASIFIMYMKKEFISNEINNIENILKISYIHWVDMPWKLRVKFAERIKNIDFVSNVSLYNNPIIQENALESFLTQVLNTENKIYRIIIDGKKGKRYEQKLKSKLKNHGFIFNNVMFLNDKTEIFLRLADFIAGLIRSHADDKNIYNEYMVNILKRKIKILN
jgi:hypothetical protein